MRILHLYSDWKWTGPAEPALQMCKSLEDRGHDVLIAYCTAPIAEAETMAIKVKEYGVQGTEQFALDRHIPPLKTLRDTVTLPRFISRKKFDVVHMHLSHDHAFGAILTKLLGRNRPQLVRTLHRRTVLEPNMGNRLQLKALADGFLTFTEGFRQQYITEYGLDPERIAVQPMSVDLERFTPERTHVCKRASFGIAADAPVIGIVGRYQKYRHADVFLEAAAKVLAEVPEARFIVIGDSGQMQETVVAPMKRLGIEHAVVLPGYLMDDYDDVMASLDIFSLLMPGFDGTARAVREAMALGLPCVVSDFGMLPDIVPHEEAGLVCNVDADQLAAAWLRLIRNEDERNALGAGALASARSRFHIDAVGPCLEQFYERLITLNRGDAKKPKAPTLPPK
ncbi:MAG: glycosyltransferase involved in cell wall biosynthesis [Rhodothermales bacterium]|jgi:glycosyltransferase involved in cell wall biosynthesis